MGTLYRLGYETFRIPHSTVWNLSKSAFYLNAYLYQTLSLEKRNPLHFDLATYVTRTGLGEKSARSAVAELKHSNLLTGVTLLHPVLGTVKYPEPDKAFDFPTFRAPFGFTDKFVPVTFKVIAYIYALIDRRNLYESDAEIGIAIKMSAPTVARELRWLRENNHINSAVLTRDCLSDGRCSPQLQARFADPSVQRIRKIILPMPEIPTKEYQQRTELEITLGYWKDGKTFKDDAVAKILTALGGEIYREGEVLICNVGDIGRGETTRVYANSGYWFYDLDTKNSRRWSVSKQTLVPVRDQNEGHFTELLERMEPDPSKLIARLNEAASNEINRRERARCAATASSQEVPEYAVTL